MMKRPVILPMLLLLCLLLPLTVSAADTTLLLPEHTCLTSQTGVYAYTPEGALMLSASDNKGATAAIELGLPVDIHQTRYVQLSLTSDVPFNIAFKLSGGEHDIFPQTAGPSWYEAFQSYAPADGGGCDPGTFTLSLDVAAYAAYNGLSIPESGQVTLQTVYVMLKGTGGLTLEHLVLSDHGDFQTALGKTGMTAYSPVAITTDTKGNPYTTQPTYDAGGVTLYRGDRSPVGVIVLLVVAAALVAGTVLMTTKKRKI